MSKESVYTDPWALKQWALTEHKSPILLLPKVTIGILNFNRIDDLRRTLDCVTLAVQYPEYEVIVADNASTDGSVEMVYNEFPMVKVIALTTNIATAARNFFYQQATGKYVFSFDDDSFPATPATIHQAVIFLEKHPECDALSFYCYQPLTGFAESGELENFRFSGSSENGYAGLYFVEGGMCIRSSAWKKIDGYDSDFIWGAEGADLTLQMYKAGMKTMYHPGFATLHMKSNINRNYSKDFYFFTRNYIWTLAKHFPLYAAIPLISFYTLRRIIAVCLNPKFTVSYIKGIKDGLLGVYVQRKKRKKINLRQVLGLKRWYLFLYRW
jgi:GT2 family glycosyltransferase